MPPLYPNHIKISERTVKLQQLNSAVLHKYQSYSTAFSPLFLSGLHVSICLLISVLKWQNTKYCSSYTMKLVCCVLSLVFMPVLQILCDFFKLTICYFLKYVHFIILWYDSIILHNKNRFHKSLCI